MKMRLVCGATAAALMFFSFGLSVSAGAEEPGAGWQFSMTPYLWLPDINGTFNFDVPPGATGKPEVEAGPGDYLSLLNFGFMGVGEARGNGWSIYGDLMFLDVSGEPGKILAVNGPGGIEIPVNVNTKINFQNTVFTGSVGHLIGGTEDRPIDVFLGFRYVGAEAEVNWRLAGPLAQFPQVGHFAQDASLFDVIAGLKGQLSLGEHWVAPFYFDVGAGDSELTWQAMAGIGYDWGSTELQLVYRHLFYDEGSDGLLQEMNLGGPAIGLTIHM